MKRFVFSISAVTKSDCVELFSDEYEENVTNEKSVLELVSEKMPTVVNWKLDFGEDVAGSSCCQYVKVLSDERNHDALLLAEWYEVGKDLDEIEEKYY